MTMSASSMSREQRAAQIWSILVFAARNRQTLTYGLLGKLIGAPPAALGDWLRPIQSYCISHALPPLTVIVVSESSGMPGTGFIGAQDVPAAQMRVFAHEWLALQAPSPAALRDAAHEQSPTTSPDRDESDVTPPQREQEP